MTWKPIPGFEGRYEVSDDGQVRSLPRQVRCGPGGKGQRFVEGTVLRPGPSNYGHMSVLLGHKNTRMVHHLVLEAFIGPRPAGAESRHLDGDPTNNRAENLCWGTRSENNRDASYHALFGRGNRRA